MNPRHRRIARHRRSIRDHIAHLGPLAKPAPLGTEVKRWGRTYKACSAPLASDDFVVKPPAGAGHFIRVPATSKQEPSAVAWRCT